MISSGLHDLRSSKHISDSAIRVRETVPLLKMAKDIPIMMRGPMSRNGISDQSVDREEITLKLEETHREATTQRMGSKGLVSIVGLRLQPSITVASFH